MKNSFFRFISLFVSLSLVNPFVFAEVNSTVAQERNQTEIQNYLYSANPTQIPYAYYSNNFIHQTVKLLDQLDLSRYNNKYIYVGYGVFDKQDNFCKYVELPVLDPKNNPADNVFSTNPSNFDKTTVVHFQNHSYVKSIMRMTYRDCLQLTNKFGGYPVTITSPLEDQFIYDKMGGNYWIGMSRKNCDSPYVNVLGYHQDYNPFLNQTGIINNVPMCNPSKLNLYVDVNGNWKPTSASDEKYCVMEIDSPYITRPLKICAPWWRVERTYKLNDQDDLDALAGGLKLEYINQADIPKTYTVCTKYDTNATAELENAAPREVTCTQYYQATAAPECLKDPFRPECHIDECAGYIENACTLIKVITPYKDYTKTQAIINGERKWIKDKQQIRTYVYQCPPSLPSIRKCEKQELVVVWPKECPGSQCEAYKQCILNSNKPAQQAEAECAREYKCEKIYPNLDLTDASCYDANGNLIKLKGKCSDGTILDFPINIENRVSKKCVKYEEVNITKEVHETCTLHRSYTDHTVDMSITGTDIYENNPNCIRINTEIDARPLKTVTVKYKSFGFSKVNVIKAYIDDNQSTIASTLPDTSLLPLSPSDVTQEHKNFFKTTYNVTVKPNVTQQEIDEHSQHYSCDFTSTWLNKISKETNMTGIVSIELVKEDDSNVAKVGYNGEIVLKFKNITKSQCEANERAVNGNGYYYSASDKYCEVYTPKTDNTLDSRFQKIAVYDGINGQTWYSANPVDKTTCNDWAACLNASYNRQDYPTDATYVQCVIDTGSPYQSSDNNVTSPPNPQELSGLCPDIPVKQGTTLTDINGLKDIFAVTDETSGSFGFFSNYVRRPYRDAEAFIDNKLVMPIIGIAHIRDDKIKYYYNITQYSILTKSPNIVAGVIAGGAVGGAGAYAGLATSAYLGPAVIAAYLAAAVFGKKTKLNRQQAFWIVYKMVPVKIEDKNNFYGYDERVKLPDGFDKNNDSLPAIYYNSNGTANYAMVYMVWGRPIGTDNYKDPIRISMYNDTGTLKSGDFQNVLNRWALIKDNEFKCAGFNEVGTPFIPAEKQIVVEYPVCKWYDYKCNKTHSQNWHGSQDLFKDMTNFYMGATNTVSIVVPYIGDYEVKAFDKHGNQLGDIIVRSNDFIDGGPNKASYAQLMFGMSMDLANGIDDGTTSKACRYDNMVEWGGGVSGIYYENNYTGLYRGCEKSNDLYVLDHSAVMFKVRPLNQDKWYMIKLDKPLPFANRVFLVTLGEKEIRKYRCYQKFGTCGVGDWIANSSSQ